MLEIAGKFEPFVLALFPNGNGGCDEIGVVERAERDGDRVGDAVVVIIYGRSAVGAEVEVGRVAAVAGVGPDFGLAGDGHLLGGEADLRGEGATAALLAIEAMTHRNAGWVAGRGGGKLAAAAGSGVGGQLLDFQAGLFAVPTTSGIDLEMNPVDAKGRHIAGSY